MFQIKRIYARATAEDGYRVLVDRVWPRGVSRQKAQIDMWMKEIAPSDQLRKWFGHDRKRWIEFRERYRAELKGKAELVRELRKLENERGTVTLVYSARDEQNNQAVALREILRGSI